MAKLARGEIVLTQFPFSDLTAAKLRPCLIVSPGLIGQDVVVAAISSVVRSGLATDLYVDASHSEFAQTKLRTSSMIRTHKLVTLEQSVIVRRLGKIGAQLQAEVDRRLRIVLGI